MDEELKVVVTSVLEADEAASAQRIAGQLPAISKMVEQQGKIKIGVEFNDANVRAESQRVKQSIKSALTTQEVGIKLRVTQDARGMLRDALSGLKVDENISQAMTRNLTNMNVEIDKINAGFIKAGKSKERLLQLTISGTDQEQRSVQIMQQYDQSGHKVAETVKQIEMNLKAQRTEAERVAKQSANANEQRVAALTKQMDALEKVRANYMGSGHGEAVLNSGNLDSLVQKYEQIKGEIQSLQTTTGAYSKTRQAEINSEIAALNRMVVGYQNAEKAERAGQSANERRLYDLQKQLDLLEKIRANYMGSGKGDAVTGESHLSELSKKYSEIESKIKALQNATGAYSKTQKAEINSDIEALNRLVVAYQKAERTATDLRSKDVTSVKTEQGFKLNEFEDKLKTAGMLTDELKAKIRTLREELAAVGDSQGMTRFLDNFGATKAQASAAAAAEQFRQKIASVNAEMAAMPSSISAMEGRMRQLSAPTDNLKANVAEVHRLMAEWSNDPSEENKIRIYEQINEKLKLCNSEITRLHQAETSGVRDVKLIQGLDKAKADLATIRRQWSAFTNDKSLEQKFQVLSRGLNNIRNQADLTKWNAQFATLKSEIKAAGLNMQSFGDVIKNNLAKVGQWLGATTIIFRAISTIKKAVSTVVDMDTAMIDLRKVTSGTAADYENFYQSANETAKALGATTEEVISQTAEWARLGYAMKDAAELAKNSAIFAAVSPGMGQELATDGLVSIIKAFDVDVEDSMDGIISKVNAVGNAFAVSNADIVNALTRSSSAMAAANNTFDETVALATAAIEITRDAESVGQGLKTLSMRIRGYDEETEEYSEDVAILTGKIADLTKTAKTPGGISLFEPGDPNTYKSTYDILKEISEIWEELTDKNRAGLLEALFGKRQAQIGAAILSNFDQAKASIETMANSAGSAEREMEKITQSLEYRINALGQTWVGVAQNIFQTGDLKAVISVLQLFSSAIEGITSKLGLFGTVALGGFITALVQAHKTVGRPKMRGFINVPTYAPVATRNERAA